jgi:hypothetical protein
MTPEGLIARWRDQATRWRRLADDHRAQHRYDLSAQDEYRAEAYENCAADLEAWQAQQAGDPPAPATPPREINCTAAVTQIRPNHDLDRRTIRPFGFRSSHDT